MSNREARRQERLIKSLKLSKAPAFTDPRIKRRAEKVLDFAYDLRLLPSGERGMKATEFYGIIGKIGRGPSDYFNTMFRKVGYYSKLAVAGQASTYKYRPIMPRVQKCADAIGYKDGLLKAAQRKGYSFLNDPGRRSELRRTGHRVYPWWALMEHKARHELFVAEHGKGWDYDIEAAKPTVTLQAWTRLLRSLKPEALKKPECKLPAWNALVADRRAYRENMAEEAGITVQQAKEVCQIVLNSGYASPVSKNAICEILGVESTKRLMGCATYLRLRADFRVFWAELKGLDAEIDVLMDLKPGEAMSHFYNKIEDEIMDVVDRELSNRGIWFIHDGFMSANQIDTKSIEEAILFETGYSIKFEESDLCQS